MTPKNDLGIAILENLIERGEQVGYTFHMNDFLSAYITETNDASKLNTWIAREIIDDMFKMGYVNTVEKFGTTGIYNYGRPENQRKDPKDNDSIYLGLTWKGKSFYYSTKRQGSLDKLDKASIYGITLLSFITTVATVWMLYLTIQGQQHSKAPQNKEGCIKTQNTNTHNEPASNGNTSTETLREKVIDKELLETQ